MQKLKVFCSKNNIEKYQNHIYGKNPFQAVPSSVEVLLFNTNEWNWVQSETQKEAWLVNTGVQTFNRCYQRIPVYSYLQLLHNTEIVHKWCGQKQPLLFTLLCNEGQSPFSFCSADIWHLISSAQSVVTIIHIKSSKNHYFLRIHLCSLISCWSNFFDTIQQKISTFLKYRHVFYNDIYRVIIASQCLERNIFESYLLNISLRTCIQW